MSDYRFETLQLHVGQEQPDPATDARAVPIYQTTSYVFRNSEHAAARFNLSDAGNVYGRITNSTQGVLEERLAALEGGTAALAVASGAAAISYTIQALAANGGHIVAQETIYGGSFNLLNNTLPQYGIETTFVNVHDLDSVKAAIKDNTKAIYLETLGNPHSDIPDIEAIAEIAHSAGIPLVIDNTFGTPYLIRPLEHGADIVVHSATKFIGGSRDTNTHSLQIQIQVIMESHSMTYLVLQHLLHISVQSYLEILEQLYLHLTLSCFFRVLRHFR